MFSTLRSIYFGSPGLAHTIKTNCTKFQTVHPDICSVIFWFLEKCLGLFSISYFLYDLSRKIFLVLYFNKCQYFIVWLISLLKMLGNVWLVITCFPVDDVIDFEINLSFLIKPFSYWSKKILEFLEIFRIFRPGLSYHQAAEESQNK